MKKRTMRLAIGSPIYNALITSMERNNGKFSFECELYDVIGVKRIEQTNYVSVALLNDVSADLCC